jgi:hypothetical protein
VASFSVLARWRTPALKQTAAFIRSLGAIASRAGAQSGIMVP